MATAGGSAAQAGFKFQNEVAALFAVHMLAGEEFSRLDLGDKGIPTRIHAETSAPVDDLLVWTKAGGRIFVNAKRTVQVSPRTRSALWSAIDQFVRLSVVVSEPYSQGQPWEGALDPGRDRLLLAFDGKTSGVLARSGDVMRRIADRASGVLRTEIPTNADERGILETVEALIVERWEALTARRPEQDELDGLIALIRFLPLDMSASDKEVALALLRPLVAHRKDANSAWVKIQAHCESLAVERAAADCSGLRTALKRGGLRLAGSPEYFPDIERLKEETRLTLEDLRHFSVLPVGRRSDEEITMARDCVAVLSQQAVERSFLLTGAAGAGKSGALFLAAHRLQTLGHPILAFAVDRHAASSLSELRNELGLEHNLVEVLHNWSGDKPGILFIDALDASRGGKVERTFRKLIADVRHQAPEWRIVASVRSFDLRFGVELRELFGGAPVHSELADTDFNDVAHLRVPRLSPAEIGQLASKASALWHAYSAATDQLQEVLTSPYNLSLFARILQSEGETTDTARLVNEVQLLDSYWDARVIDCGSKSHRRQRETLLRQIAEQMISHQSLLLDGREPPLADAEAPLDELLASEVLVARFIRRNGPARDISFAHHALFDYAVARVVLDAGESPDLADRLTASDDTALWLAPATLLAFRMLWEREPGRGDFWSAALTLAVSDKPRTFCRTLPARVAVEYSMDLADFSPVLSHLELPDDPKRSGAVFLLRQTVGAILAGIAPACPPIGPAGGPWCGLIRAMVERAAREFLWPVNAALADWTEKPEVITDQQRVDLAAASRGLLNYVVENDVDFEAAISAAVKGVARTFSADPKAAALTLKRLLDPDRVAIHGHRDLFWLVQEQRRFLNDAPHLLADTIRAAFLTALPERGQTRQIGKSRILSLTTDTRQDLQVVRHLLAERFKDFTTEEPALVSDTLRAILDDYVPRRGCRDTQRGVTFQFGAQPAKVIPDGSYIWWQPGEDRRGFDDELSLLDGWVSGLALAVDRELLGAEELEKAVARVAPASEWAVAWCACLRAAALRPERLGRFLLPVLHEHHLLDMLELRHASAELLRVLHPLLSEAERLECEAAVMKIPEQEARLRFLGCLELPNIALKTARTERIAAEESAPLPDNEPPFHLVSEWSGGDPDWWLREGGADPGSEPDASLLALARSIEEAKCASGNREESCRAVLAAWPDVLRLVDMLAETPEAHLRVRSTAWQAIGAKVARAAELCKSKEDLDAFNRLEQVLRLLIQPNEPMSPDGKPDAEREKNFARSPSWGSPAPRLEGARALMAFLRASTSGVSDDLLGVANLLASDGAPEVRLQILERLNFLCDVTPSEMWRFFQWALDNEHNPSVLAFTVSSLAKVAHLERDWVTERLITLVHENDRRDVEERDDLTRQVVHTLLRLWVAFGHEPAGSWILSVAEDPLVNGEKIQIAAGSLRTAIRQGQGDAPDPHDEEVRSRARQFFRVASSTGVAKWQAALAVNDASAAQKLLPVLDVLAQELYFGSGAYESRPKDEFHSLVRDEDPARQARFLTEFSDILAELASTGHPAVTHHVIETLEAFVAINPGEVFLLICAAVEAGRAGGYQFEDLGATLLVRLVRRYLADHRALIASREELRRGLIRCLDAFADAGWPEARKLAYELPVLLR